MVLVAMAIGSCAPSPRAPAARHTGMEFLAASLRPWPDAAAETRLVVQSPGADRVAIYDNALAALVFVRAGRRDEAARILLALARLQREDGAIAFSFGIDEAADAPAYVRSGAIAWVGFAAVAYLDADRGGAGRDAIARMAHEIARYLLAHQVHSTHDPRDGLITGGFGSLVYEISQAGLRERLVPGEIEWASTEHNVDAFFFLRALGRVSESPAYIEASGEIEGALAARAWNDPAGQMSRGVSARGWDAALALDCASWSAMMLVAAGDRLRAQTALSVADVRYASRDPASGVRGHRPYVHRPIFEDDVLARSIGARAPAADWDQLSAVWPEGSAGVALAAIRLGRRDRAASIVAGLEPLRDPSGGLPTLTVAIPFEFDTGPSVAGTAWAEIVRDELAHPDLPPLVWPP
jgi:hypothetical protein